MLSNNDSGWYTIEGDVLCECLRCKHQGYEHAEHDGFILDKETGEHEVFCPECKSDLYFITEQEEEADEVRSND